MNALDLDHVGMSEIRVSASPEVAFIVPGLGSCIALVMYQPRRQLAGMAHILLPESLPTAKGDLPGKFADTAVPQLFTQLLAMGADRAALVAKFAGGSQMFKTGSGPSIGERNALAVHEALAAVGVPVLASDVGGDRGRTIRFEIATERFFVRPRGGEERVLA